MAVLLIWIAATAVTGYLVMRIPAVYYSDALVVVDSPKIPERFISSIVTNDFQDRLTRITQQIQSSTRLKEIIDEVKLFPNERMTTAPEDLVQTMRRNIRLTMEGGRGRRANAFRIGFEGASPSVVAQVATRLANLYIEENLRVRESQAEGTTEFVDAQLQESKKRLDELEAAISRYKQQHSGELPQQETTMASVMARLQTDLRLNSDALERARDARLVLESTLSVAEGNIAALSRRAGPAVAPPEPDAPAAPAPRKARPSDVVEAELRALSTRYTPQHPEVRRLRQKLSAMRAAEAQEPAPAAEPQAVTAPRRSVATAPARPDPEESADLVRARERVVAIQAQIRRGDKEMAARESEVARLQRESAVLQQRLQQMPVREQEYARITRDYQITKGNYESLMAKKLSAEMSTDLERRQKAERFTILEPAHTPSRPSRPNRLALNLGGSAAGLLLGMVIVLARELKRDVLLGEWELPEQYPVLGRLPRIKLPPAPEGRA